MESVPMFVNNWLAILATTGNLGLVIVILRRAQPSPMRLPLLLLCATMTVWSFATAMYGMFGLSGWRWLSVMAAPFMVPLALDVVLAFGGRRRKYAWFVYLMYGVYTVLSLAGGWLLYEGVRSDTHPHAQAWAAICMAGVLAPLFYVTYRLLRHASERPSEATQARVLLTGLLIGLAIGSTELLNNFFPNLPALGQLGTLTIASTLTIVTLRFQLLDVRIAVGGWLIGVGTALARHLWLSAVLRCEPVCVRVVRGDGAHVRRRGSVSGVRAREAPSSRADGAVRDIGSFLGSDGARSQEPSRSAQRRASVHGR